MGDDDTRKHVAGPDGEPDDDGWFTSGARYWLDVYRSAGLDGQIYRRRLDKSIEWLDALHLKSGFAALDAGCGAGDFAMALAPRGGRVVASDLSMEMTEIARKRLNREAWNACVLRSDAHHLPFLDGTFDLVVALGLLPWVRSPQSVITELARVARPGGHILLSFDNAARLFRLTDPKLAPMTVPLRRLVRRGRPRPMNGNRMIRPQQAQRSIASAGLTVVKTGSVGFGPPTFLSRPIGSQSVRLWLDTRLQRQADRVPSPLSRLGVHYLVLARRQPLHDSDSNPLARGRKNHR